MNLIDSEPVRAVVHSEVVVLGAYIIVVFSKRICGSTLNNLGNVVG